MKMIVLVEDATVSAMVLEDFLGANGYAVTRAKNGVEGVERFEKDQPDLLLVDVMLPRKNGFEVCFEVKRTERGRHTPVLLMSAFYRDEDHGAKYAHEGLRADAYMVKPFDMQQMLARIRELLAEAA